MASIDKETSRQGGALAGPMIQLGDCISDSNRSVSETTTDCLLSNLLRKDTTAAVREIADGFLHGSFSS